MIRDSEFRQHVDDIKARVSGRDVASAFGATGRGKRIFCPICQPSGGKTPDLDIFDGGWKCYKCGKGGDVIDLVVLLGRMSKAEAIRWIEQRTGIRTPSTGKQGGRITSRPAATLPERSDAVRIKQPTPDPAVDTSRVYVAFLADVCQDLIGTPGADYLAGRGIDVAIAAKAGVRYCSDPSGMWDLATKDTVKASVLTSFYGFQRARVPFIVFPYILAGRPVFLKGRCLLSKVDADARKMTRFLNTGGHVPCLWNHDAIASADRVLICEGEIDALTALTAGHIGVCLPGWSHWKDTWTAEFIDKMVVLVLDADDAGRKGSKLVAKSFLQAGLPAPRQVVFPEGQDLNEFFLSRKTESMTEGKAR